MKRKVTGFCGILLVFIFLAGCATKAGLEGTPFLTAATGGTPTKLKATSTWKNTTPAVTKLPTSTTPPTATPYPTATLVPSSSVEYEAILVQVGMQGEFCVFGGYEKNHPSEIRPSSDFSYNGRSLTEIADEINTTENAEQNYGNVACALLAPQTAVTLYNKTQAVQTVKCEKVLVVFQYSDVTCSVAAELSGEITNQRLVGLTGTHNPLPRPVEYGNNAARADFDGDGSTDTLRINRRRGNTAYCEITINGVTAEFCDFNDYPSDYYIEIYGIYDLNGDGCLELILFSFYGYGVSYSIYQFNQDANGITIEFVGGLYLGD